MPGCRTFSHSDSLYSMSTQNKQLQDQTKLGFYNFLYNWEEVDFRKQIGKFYLWFDPWVSKSYQITFSNFCTKPQRFLKCTSTFLCLTFPWNLKPRIRARYHSDISSWRSSTDEDCRAVLLFMSYRPRVIHTLSWGERRLHYEWHSARQKHSCTLTWFHWPPNKLLPGALISSYLPQA